MLAFPNLSQFLKCDGVPFESLQLHHPLISKTIVFLPKIFSKGECLMCRIQRKSTVRYGKGWAHDNKGKWRTGHTTCCLCTCTCLGRAWEGAEATGGGIGKLAQCGSAPGLVSMSWLPCCHSLGTWDSDSNFRRMGTSHSCESSRVFLL